MTSIIISSDEDSVCRTIGKKTAAALGYRYLGESFLKQVAATYDVKEDKLHRVLGGATSLRLTNKSRQLLLAYIQTATLEEMAKDSVVCVGLGAHLYVRDVSHVLMIQVLGDPAGRSSRVVGEKMASPRKTQKLLERERAQRARWSVESFGIDECSPSIYDMVISLGQIGKDKVVEIIQDMAGYRKFQPMTYSRRCLQNLATASKVRTALLPRFPEIRVTAEGDKAIVRVKCAKRQKLKAAEAIKEIAGAIAGIGLVEVHAVHSMRDLNAR